MPNLGEQEGLDARVSNVTLSGVGNDRYVDAIAREHARPTGGLPLSYEDIFGRTFVNYLDAILAITNSDAAGYRCQGWNYVGHRLSATATLGVPTTNPPAIRSTT